MSRKVLITVNIEPEQHERLKRLSKRTGVSQGRYVRDALDAFLVRFADEPGEWPEGVGEWDEGSCPTATRLP